MPVIKGHATEQDTKAYADRIWQENPKVSPDSWRIIEGLTVGKIGFGTYRMSGIEQQKEALKKALTSGINLIDTSSNYMDGEAEKLISEALGELIADKKIKREEVVIISKGGYIQGQQRLEKDQNPPAETVQVADHLWHCIHPDFLAEQIFSSLCRLNVETIDGYLIHNPEYFLAKAAIEAQGQEIDFEVIKQEYYKRLEQAFVKLEEQVKEGKIGFYGVSSNTFVLNKEAPDHTDLARIFEAAQNAAQIAHGRKKRPMLRMIQLPLNLLELDAVKNINTSAHIIDGKEDVSTLELASRMHLSVLANRPLNAFPQNGEVYRLASDNFEDKQDVFKLLDDIKKIETELNHVLGGWPQVEGHNVFSFTAHGEELFAHIENSVHFDHMQSTFFIPTLALMMQALASHKQENPDVEKAQEAYRSKFIEIMHSLRERCRQSDSEALREFEFQLRDRLDETWCDAPVQQIALGAISSIPGVSSVLCGMRSPQYVDDAITVFEKGDFKDVGQVIGTGSSNL